MEKEKVKQKPGPDPLLLALRCSRASLLLSSLRHPPRSPPPTTTTTRRSSYSSSSVEFELRNARLLDAELAAARRAAAELTWISGADLLFVVALVPLLLLLLLFVALLAAATAEA